MSEQTIEPREKEWEKKGQFEWYTHSHGDVQLCILVSLGDTQKKKLQMKRRRRRNITEIKLNVWSEKMIASRNRLRICDAIPCDAMRH